MALPDVWIGPAPLPRERAGLVSVTVQVVTAADANWAAQEIAYADVVIQVTAHAPGTTIEAIRQTVQSIHTVLHRQQGSTEHGLVLFCSRERPLPHLPYVAPDGTSRMQTGGGDYRVSAQCV